LLHDSLIQKNLPTACREDEEHQKDTLSCRSQEGVVSQIKAGLLALHHRLLRLPRVSSSDIMEHPPHHSDGIASGLHRFPY